MKRVAVGLSGGVDSAVCALLLKQQGYEVVGVHLYCWPPKSEIERDGVTREEWIKKNGCRADEDRVSALKTALEIGIPFRELDFSEEYNSRVIKYFYDEYEAGRTPNPDILCNSEIKFGLFLDWALVNGFDSIATGHYALLKSGNILGKTDSSSSPAEDAYLHTRPENSAHSGNQAFQDCVSSFQDVSRLYIPKDKHKDQTYFLWKLTEKELKHVLFPLGGKLKSEVREVAKNTGMSVAGKKDSQGICFVGNVEVRDFLKRRLRENVGEVVNINGEVIGKHNGVAFYTIGQRGGWVLNSKRQKLEKSKNQNGDVTKVYYVVDKDSQTNRLIVGDKDEVMSNKISIENISLINHKKDEGVAFLQKLSEQGELFVRIRHGGELVKVEKVEFICIDSGSRSGMTDLVIKLDRDVFGVASGQSAVFYCEAGECLGGGVIV